METVGLKTMSVLFFIELSTRGVHLAAVSTHPHSAWITQQGRNLAIGEQPCRTPQANAFAERWVRGVRQEYLDRVLVWGAGHHERVFRDYVHHYSAKRPHRGLELGCPLRRPTPTPTSGFEVVERRDRLGALIHEYFRCAA